jgi:predicted ATP-grasp superfamily ATP-dependent carboligase
VENVSLLVVGASVRAAAWSALRSGGIRPWCVDLFADADLQRVCVAHALPTSAYPRGFLEAARQAPAGPWLYTGALENHPGLIAAISRERPLWGNPAAVVRRVRSPRLLAKVLRNACLPCPSVAETLPLDPAKAWLLKPRRSAGGAHIHAWRGQPIPVSHYCQEWIEGDACSALFAGQRNGSATFLGATRQLVGLPWLNADGFRYCGNVGPLALATTTQACLVRLGDVLASGFSLRGFFGVDFILRDGIPWPVEINPRYTAAVEVLERAAGSSLFSYHSAAFAPEHIVASTGKAPALGHDTVHGKAILFARTPVRFPAAGPWQEGISRTEPESPDYADIPHPSSRIDKGQPILTIFACAATESACLDSLREKAQALDRRVSD